MGAERAATMRHTMRHGIRHGRSLLLALAACLGSACNDAHKGVTAPSGNNARLQLGATALLAADATVLVRLSYPRKDGTSVELGTKSTTVSPGGSTPTQTLSLTVDIASCLVDVNKVIPAGGVVGTCPAKVDIQLTRGTTVLDAQSRNVNLAAGQTLSLPDPITLYEVTQVKLTLGGPIIAGTPVKAEVGQRVTATANVLDRTGAEVAGRTVTWTTSAPTVLKLSATTGANINVDVLGVGAATITASSGERSIVVSLDGAPESARSVVIKPADSTVFLGDTVRYSAEARGVSGLPIAGATFAYSSVSPAVVISTAGVAVTRALGTATIVATSASGPGGVQVTGTTTLVVVPRPALIVTPTSLDLSADSATTVPLSSAVVTVSTNTGVTGLTATTAYTAGQPTGWITTTLDKSTAPATLGVQLTTQSLLPGVYTANITLAAAAGLGVAPVILPVRFTVRSAVQLTATPSTIDFGTLDSGVVAAAQVVNISTGDGRVASGLTTFVTLGANTTVQWLSATLATVSTNTTLRLVPIGTLRSGTYNATVTVQATTPTSAQPVRIPVTFKVVAPRTTGTLQGRVFDYVTNTGIVGASVSIRDDLQQGATVLTDASGNFVSPTLIGGPFTITVTATGYTSVTVRNIAVGGVRILDAVPMVRIAVGTGTITGTVKDATRNAAILTSATLQLFAGQNTLTGTPVATVATSLNGTYSFSNVPAGTYTIVGKAIGFSDGSRTGVSVGGSQITPNQDLFLSPTGSAIQLRIVLSWGAQPADLDSYLSGPNGSGGTFTINYGNPGSCAGAPFSCLDVDVTNGRGPETITVTRVNSGRYLYQVHNYTDGGLTTSSTLSQSSARVDVFSATGLIQSFAVPSGVGTLWSVFDWDGTTIRPINTISNNPPPIPAVPAGSILAGPRKQAKKNPTPP